MFYSFLFDCAHFGLYQGPWITFANYSWFPRSGFCLNPLSESSKMPCENTQDPDHRRAARIRVCSWRTYTSLAFYKYVPSSADVQIETSGRERPHVHHNYDYPTILNFKKPTLWKQQFIRTSESSWSTDDGRKASGRKKGQRGYVRKRWRRKPKSTRAPRRCRIRCRDHKCNNHCRCQCSRRTYADATATGIPN